MISSLLYPQPVLFFVGASVSVGNFDVVLVIPIRVTQALLELLHFSSSQIGVWAGEVTN
jgi:hypothetical protein